MRATSVTLLLSAAVASMIVGAGAFAATVYKWVDENGVTHYSDQPHPQAQQLDVKSAQSYSAPQPPAASRGTTTNGAQSSSSPYAACDFTRPENDEVFFNTATITASFRPNPTLRNGDRVWIGLDGKRQMNQPPVGTSFTLTVERGTHTILATIEDASGNVICTSSTLTFHVRQPSVQAPNRANRPKF